MKLLLLLQPLVRMLLLGYTATLDITCDDNYCCTIKQLNVQQLQHLPKRLAERLNILVVKQSYIPTLDGSLFHPNLHELDLVNCKIDKLILQPNCSPDYLIIEETVGSIETVRNTRLSFLSIANSQISDLFPAISNMTALVNIRLQKMHIPTFNLDVLQGKEKLFSVELNFDRMEALHLSPNRTCCKILAELDLSYNHFTHIDLALFNRMQALKKLLFQSNRIVALNGTLELPDLLELDLATNRLETIDLCRWKTESLLLLNVENNRIRHLLNCIEQLKNLVSFRIANNLLVELDMTPFAKLAMRYIGAAHNRIETVSNQYVLKRETCFILDGNPVSNSSEYCNGLQGY